MLSKFLIPRRLFSRNIKDIKRRIEIKESKELELEEEAEERKRRFKKKFFDSLRIYVRGGGGGQGIPKYGGVGGKGGDVHVISSKDITLKKVYDTNPSKRYIAGTGTDSRSVNLTRLEEETIDNIPVTFFFHQVVVEEVCEMEMPI